MSRHRTEHVLQPTLSRHNISVATQGHQASIETEESLSRPQPLSPNPNPVATQHSLLRHEANTSLSQQRSLCRDPTLLACLGTLSRHCIPCHDTVAPTAEDSCRDTLDHVVTWNPTTLVPTKNELSRAQNQVAGALALLCALLRVQLAFRARMHAALAMCALSRPRTPVATKKTWKWAEFHPISFLQFRNSPKCNIFDTASYYTHFSSYIYSGKNIITTLEHPKTQFTL